MPHAPAIPSASLALLTWAAPAFLPVLALAAGIPVLAHLLSQRGGRLAVLPTVRFIQQAVDEGRRRVRVRDLLLLLLRAMALALIVAGFARPLWHRADPALLERGVVAVLVLDRSASMNRTERGASLLDQARQRVLRELDAMDPATHRANVVLLDGSPTALASAPTANFSLLRSLVEGVQPGWGRGDLDAALLLAHAQRRAALNTGGPDAEAAAPRELRIEVHTDGQATQAVPAAAPGMMTAATGDGGAAVLVHRVGAPAENAAVFHPRLTPAQPVAGQGVTLSAEVAWFPKEPAGASARSLMVRMTIPGMAPVSQAVTVTPGAPATVSFRWPAAQAGVRRAEFALTNLPAEDFAPDNQTSAHFEVAATRTVLLATAADAGDPGTAAYFVRRALQPQPSRGDPSQPGSADLAGVSLRVVTPMELAASLAFDSAAGAADLPATVLLIEAGGVDAQAHAALRRHLQQGGGVVWVIDSAAAARSLAAFGSADPHQPASPLEFPGLAPAGPGVAASRLDLSQGRFDNPLVDVFEGPARAALLAQRFLVPATAKATPLTTTLLSYSDGSAMLAARWVGAGRLAALNADLSPAGGDLVKGPALVPLLHQLVRGLAPGPEARRTFQPGERAGVVIPGAWSLADLLIDDPAARRDAVVRLAPSRRHTWLEFPARDRPGDVEVRAAADPGRLLAAAHTEIAAEESDFRVVPPTPDAAKPNGPDGPGAGGGMTEATAARERGTELWPWLLLAATLALAMEQALASLDGLWRALAAPWRWLQAFRRVG